MPRLRLSLSFSSLSLSPPAPRSSAAPSAGTVTDASGAAIPNAHVLVHNDDTGAQRALTTNASGQYIASSIAGRVPIRSPPTRPASPKPPAPSPSPSARSLNLNLALSVSGQRDRHRHTKLSPSSTRPPSKPPASSTRARSNGLPLNGRSYDQLILLNPGTVNYTNQRSGGVGTSNSSVGSMFSVSGRRPQDNLFLLNGIEYTGASLINNTPGGTSGQLLGIDGIREFNVVTDTYSAAYGKRDGAQISIVTTGGTNQLHGSVYEFIRNSFFDARNYFDGPRIPEFQRNNFGASLGGPIRKNKLFLFANYEGYRQNLGESLVTLVPDATSRAHAVASVKPLLNLWPIANGPEITQNGAATGIAEWIGTAPQHIREDFGTTRFDANLSNNDTFNSIYTIDDSDAVSPSANPYSYVDENLREQVLSAEEHHVFSPNFINVARFGFSRASYYFNGYVPAEQQALAPSVRPGVPTYAVVISGSTASNGASSITGAGANVGANNSIARNLFTFDDHVFYTVGKHTLEGGIWIQRLQSNDNLAQDQYGQASFASLSTFLTGAIKTFTYAPNITELGWRTLFADAFLEDTWRITPRLQIRAGFRSESSTGWSESQNRASIYTFGAVSNGAPLGVISTNPTSGLSNALTDNRALFLPEPRIGLAWDAFGNGRTSVTAIAGLHHSLLDALDYRLDQAAPYNTVNSYSSTTVANPISGTPKISPSTVATNISTPALFSYTLQDRAAACAVHLAHRSATTARTAITRSLTAISTSPTSKSSPTTSIYYPTTTKANNAVANTTSWWSGGTGNYNAFIVDLRHNLSHGLQFRINYTWSKNLDDGSAWNTSVSSNTPAFVAGARALRISTTARPPPTSATSSPPTPPTTCPSAAARPSSPTPTSSPSTSSPAGASPPSLASPPASPSRRSSATTPPVPETAAIPSAPTSTRTSPASSIPAAAPLKRSRNTSIPTRSPLPRTAP